MSRDGYHANGKPIRPREADEEARAFNEGSDARIAGRPLSWNPYTLTSRRSLYWRLGWKHVSKFWGCAVHGAYYYKPLPEMPRER